MYNAYSDVIYCTALPANHKLAPLALSYTPDRVMFRV